MDWLSNALHAISQGLLYPVIIILLIFIAYAVVSLGSVIVEAIVERRCFKAVAANLVRSIEEAKTSEMPEVIEESGLLNRQKDVLTKVFENRDLPEEGRWALAKKLLAGDQKRTSHRYALDNLTARVAPMFGLMGTLIPLGPGIVAMGQGQTNILASSLLIAFDTTVAGLIAAAVCFVIARVRRRWYGEYNDALEMAVTTMLEKIDLMEEGHDPADTRREDPLEVLKRADERPVREKKPRVSIKVVSSDSAHDANEEGGAR